MRGFNAYNNTRKESASKPQIVVMLFQEVLKRLVAAENALAEGDWRTNVECAHHVRSIFLELSMALDDDVAPELCSQLRGLYRWCVEEMVKVGRNRDVVHIHNVRSVAMTLLEGWQVAIQQPEAVP